MLISPPFLPARTANQNDDGAWVDAAMPGGTPGDGSYPVSFNLGWHGGIHLTAPAAATASQVERVRAIADGTVVYLRAPTPVSNDPNHAQNYRGGWTDNGCVIIRHVTEIGAAAQGNAPTRVVFFSIYMHLDEINSTHVRLNQPIYRKTELGRAGRIYGSTERKIHFEIICDQANLQSLVNRVTGDLATGSDGRSDSVFGELYFHLPATTQAYAARPALNLATGTGGANLGEELFVGIRYERGNALVTTYRADGTPLGAALTEADAEYDLYTHAEQISQAYPATGRPASSAVYELLRFGRVINTVNETLTPADTPHWRQIRTRTGQGWINLNTTAIHKFSDADFPQWSGWKLVDDDNDGNSQCNSAIIKAWLDANSDSQVPYEADPASAATQEARTNLQSDALQTKLRRCICKFPTEWDAGNFDQRYGWLKTKTAENPNPLTTTSYDKLKAHIEALAFWPANLQVPQYDAQGAETGQATLDPVHWNFHPREFVKHFRQCGWLSKHELARVYPDSKHPQTALRTEGRGRTPETVREHYRIDINKVMRKYLITTPARMTHFFGQGAVESLFLCLMVEGSASFSRNPRHASFQPETNGFYVPTRPNDYLFYLENRLGNIDAGDGPKFRGRGMKQLTGRENYSKYWVYRGWLDPVTFQFPWWNPSRPNRAPNIPNPQELSTNTYSAIDAGGWYWQAGAASNQFRTINTIINNDTIDRTTVRAVARAINGVNRQTGDPNGLTERLNESQDVETALMDRP